jgi:hypothetical protein
MLLAVAGSSRIAVFDLRKLAAPLARIENDSVFPHSRASGQEHASWCEGAQFNASGTSLLLTSRMGEAVVISLRHADSAPTVVASYFHGAAARHFLPSREDSANTLTHGFQNYATAVSPTATTTSPAVPAQFAHPHLSASVVAQPAASLFSGRHLLIYESVAVDDTQAAEHQRRLSLAAGEPTSHHGRPAALRYQVQFRENDLPRHMAVNRRFGIVAVGAKSSTWFAVRSTDT